MVFFRHQSCAAVLAASAALLLSSAPNVLACEPNGHDRIAMAKRQATGTVRAPTPTAFPTAALTAISATETTEPVIAVPTYTAGSVSPVQGAPPLPNIAQLNPALYPALDLPPPINSPEVQGWLAAMDLSKAPRIALKGQNGCSNTTFNAAALTNAGANAECWWTCGGCTRPTDITLCPTKNTWGMSYDDGPSPFTPRLLQALDSFSLKSTFFVVGSRAISRPAMLQAEYMAGHQISVHTWSHRPLTELSNEDIVAELGWTRKIIKDVTGLSPNTMRPPYGDIDDRVRYICAQMGLTPIIWTSVGTENFDTQDWRIGAGQSPASVFQNFQNVLSTSSTLNTGFIVLAHDLYQQSVDLAVNFILPRVVAANVLKLEPISTCQGLSLAGAYVETAGNSTTSPSSAAASSGAASTGAAASSGSRAPSGTSQAGAASSAGAAASASASARPTGAANAVFPGHLGWSVAAFASGAFLLRWAL